MVDLYSFGNTLEEKEYFSLKQAYYSLKNNNDSIFNIIDLLEAADISINITQLLSACRKIRVEILLIVSLDIIQSVLHI